MEEAEALALRARNAEERRAFQEIAEIWRRLAGEAQRPAARPTDGEPDKTG